MLLVSEPLLYHEAVPPMKPSVRLGLLLYCSREAGLVVFHSTPISSR
jgi:hypothetical protein